MKRGTVLRLLIIPAVAVFLHLMPQKPAVAACFCSNRRGKLSASNKMSGEAQRS